MVSKYEFKAKKELEEDGWRVDDKRGMGRWSKNRDFFNIFDLVAIKKGNPIRWISIKGKAGVPGAHRKELDEFWMPKGNVKEVWSKSMSKKKYWRKVVLD